MRLVMPRPARLVFGLLCLAWPSTILGQTSTDLPRPTGPLRGGEVAVTGSPRTDPLFFNYTSYEQNALRLARLRLLGEYRLPGRLALLGELRAENTEVDIPALFLRWRPSARAALHVQIGRIPPVIGAFGRRAYGPDNLVMGYPLAYQYLTSLRPDALPASVDDLFRMRGRGWRPSYPIGATTATPGLPLVSVFRGDTGVQVHWAAGRISVAGAVTLGSSARPRLRHASSGPGLSGRVAVQTPAGVTVGLSGSRGPWIDRTALDLVPAGTNDRADQTVIGIDGELARGRWILRSELWRSSFAVPTLSSSLVARTGFLEARYRFHPRWQAATRLDHLTFSTVRGSQFAGAPTPWDAPVWRVESVLGYRPARRLELRAGWQHNWRMGTRTRQRGFPAVQALFWF